MVAWGKPHGKPHGRSWTYRTRFSQLINGANRRGVKVSLSETAATAMMRMSCFYCDTPARHNIRSWWIDRWDNSRGYSIDNCVPCCSTCNMMKGHGLGGFEFVTKSIQISKHFNSESVSRANDIQPSDSRKLHRRYAIGAKRRHLKFDLTEDQVGFLVSQCCFYCNAQKTGIDRMNNTKGYSKRNSVPCCWVCNRMKGRLTVEQFVYRCNRIRLRWEK